MRNYFFGYDGRPCPLAYGRTELCLFDVFSARMPIEFYRKGDKYNQTSGKPYQLVAVAGERWKLSARPLLCLQKRGGLVLQVKNYYDDALVKNQVIIANQTTDQHAVDRA